VAYYSRRPIAMTDHVLRRLVHDWPVSYSISLHREAVSPSRPKELQ